MTEKSLELAAEAGAGCVEIFINSHQEFSAPFFEKLGQIAASRHVDIVSIHPFTSGSEPMAFFSNYPRRFEDGLAQYRAYFLLAASVGARYFVFHGASPHTCLSNEQVYERFALLAGEARACGVTLLQENVVRCKSGSLSFIRGMREYLGGAAAFVLDTKQALRAGSTAEEMRSAMGDALRHVHISDFDALHDCIPPGKGTFDIRAFAHGLDVGGYSGDIVIELYQDSFSGVGELHGALAYMEKILRPSPLLSTDFDIIR